jgi:hypothetical protein
MVLNLFSFAGPCFTALCVLFCVISLDGGTNTRYKMTNLNFLCVRKFYMSTHKYRLVWATDLSLAAIGTVAGSYSFGDTFFNLSKV